MVKEDPAVDRTRPDGPWEFDDDVTRVFDDMLRRSIPQYDVMRATVDSLIDRYRQDSTEIVDLGASRGEAIARAVAKHWTTNTFAAIETSEPMAKAFEVRFAEYLGDELGGPHGSVRLLRHDLRQGLPMLRPTSVALAILTLQFIPIEYRPTLIRDVYDRLVPGGAFVVVEKVLGRDAGFHQAFSELYRAHKSAQGYSDEEIDRKALSLEGRLVPATAEMNLSLLRDNGFAAETFWRWLNFAGFLAVKR